MSRLSSSCREALQSFLQLMRSSWDGTDSTCCAVVIGGDRVEAGSPDSAVTIRREEIRVGGVVVGFVEVAYMGERISSSIDDVLIRAMANEVAAMLLNQT